MFGTEFFIVTTAVAACYSAFAHSKARYHRLEAEGIYRMLEQERAEKRSLKETVRKSKGVATGNPTRRSERKTSGMGGSRPSQSASTDHGFATGLGAGSCSSGSGGLGGSGGGSSCSGGSDSGGM